MSVSPINSPKRLLTIRQRRHRTPNLVHPAAHPMRACAGAGELPRAAGRIPIRNPESGPSPASVSGRPVSRTVARESSCINCIKMIFQLN